jgi:nitrite reductase (NADH) small subunit
MIENCTKYTSETIIWILACSVDDIPENGGGCVLVANQQIAIFNFSRTGDWFAAQNLCPHKQTMALSRGMIGDLNGEPKVACPFHKKTFSLESGDCLSGEEYSIKTYPIKVENGKVYISL